jgi:hypothetical protein
MGFRDSDPFGSDAYIDELETLNRRPSPKMLELMRRARSVDPLARRFVDCVALCLNILDCEPIDFAVMIDDVQDLDFDYYEELLCGGIPLGAGIAAVPRDGRRFRFRLLVCAGEPGVRVGVDEMFEAPHGRVHMHLDGPGALSKVASPPAPRSRNKSRVARAARRGNKP